MKAKLECRLLATTMVLLALVFHVAPGRPAVAQSTRPNPYGSRYDGYGASAYGRRGRAPQVEPGFAPPGLVLTLVMMTSLSSRTAHKGDPVQASLTRNVPLPGGEYIPAGAVVSGQVTEASASGMLEHGGSLALSFDRLTLPDGRAYPVSATILGGLGNVGSGNLSCAETKGSAGYRNRMESTGMYAATGNLYQGGIGLAAAPLYGANFTRGLLSSNTLFGGANILRGSLRHGPNVIVPSGVPFQVRLNNALNIGRDPAGLPGAASSQGPADSGF